MILDFDCTITVAKIILNNNIITVSIENLNIRLSTDSINLYFCLGR